MASILSAGIARIEITTDPVELWASPTSRSRIEKEYFDSNFSPFYRTEQIIIHATGLPDVLHNTSAGQITFGPVFSREFLLEVKNIQDKIRKVSSIVNHTKLEDICFAPLTSDQSGPVTSEKCAVMSIWGYFKDSEEIFNDEDENYLDHFLYCVM